MKYLTYLSMFFLISCSNGNLKLQRELDFVMGCSVGVGTLAADLRIAITKEELFETCVLLYRYDAEMYLNINDAIIKKPKKYLESTEKFNDLKT